ncbi:sigma-70 family RNA polymerase sigma factor [Streptomyces sp. TG1A-8]|uniref:sigma-70 family RNA polymerase sigma factor n=1 Tax=Streptomyces sp. TG1A-8 TaxID=3051385 RepID=UPI00265BF208|nr:sigma-70 family RNA polymerase sigma factor [Streptomyces sp. TG1A-8]MDO0927035.1 sigma-70 family RNA polymerase sigma factor [Streptomyces sp. TG1A-8]
MGADGWGETRGDGGPGTGGPASPQVPAQDGRTGAPRRAGPRERSEGGAPVRRDGGVPPRGVPPADGELIQRLRAGDDSAYEELYRRHADAVRRYARTCCRDPHTADDLTAEVFARTLQAVRGGSGPEYAVRAYLLTCVRHVAARWTRSAGREQLVDDFAVFAERASRGPGAPGDDALDPGADVRALHEAEQSMAMRAFRSLPERWQAVLWHTEVEDESPGEVAVLFGLDANGTRVLASRAREGLRQAYLQAHVSAALAAGGECARHAGRLGAHARRKLRVRAERDLRKHLDACARCRLAVAQLEEVASAIPAVVPVAVIGWFGTAGYAKALGIVAGGAGAGAAGAAAAPGSSGGAGAGGGAAVPAALGAPVKAGIAAGMVAVAVAAVALALVDDGSPAKAPAGPSPAAPAVRPRTPAPAPPPPGKPSVPRSVALGPEPVRTPAPAPKHGPAPGPAPSVGTPRPVPTPTGASGPDAGSTPVPDPEPTSGSAPTPAPPPAPPSAPSPAPAVYEMSEIHYDVDGDGTGPEIRLRGSSWIWQRYGMSVGGKQYARGATVSGESTVTIDLNRRCTAYDALAGVDDMGPGPGGVSFSVHADGVRLWRSATVRGGDAAVPVRVDVTGRRTVRLVVEPRGDAPGRAVPADWAESRFTCR